MANIKNLLWWVFIIIVIVGISSIIIKDNFVNSPLNENRVSGLIPGTNYSCNEIIPENISIFFDSLNGLDKLGNSKINLRRKYSFLKNGASLGGGCLYNLQTGEKASEFSCRGNFIIEDNQISDAGIIQEKNPRKIIYNMEFDDLYCSVVEGIGWSGKMGILECKILNSSCSWEYVN